MNNQTDVAATPLQPIVMASEIWRPVVGFESTHVVSSTGRIRSHSYTRKICNQRQTPQGYMQVTLRKGTAKRTLLVHRIVAEAFLVKPDGCDLVNHIDHDKTNNAVSNLQWVDRSENATAFFRHKELLRGQKMLF